MSGDQPRKIGYAATGQHPTHRTEMSLREVGFCPHPQVLSSGAEDSAQGEGQSIGMQLSLRGLTLFGDRVWGS